MNDAPTETPRAAAYRRMRENDTPETRAAYFEIVFAEPYERDDERNDR